MDDLVKLALTYAVVPLVLGAVGFIMRNIHVRLDRLEEVITQKLDQKDVRQIISDKIDPIRDDIKDLKDQNSEILKLLISNNKG